MQLELTGLPKQKKGLAWKEGLRMPGTPLLRKVVGDCLGRLEPRLSGKGAWHRPCPHFAHHAGGAKRQGQETA